MHQAGIATIGDLARADVARLHAMFGAMGPHLHELALGRDPRPVVGDYERKSYGEESTFEHDLALDSLELARVLIAHSDALGRRLRADRVRARTVTLKLKLARPLGQGRYPIVTRSQSLEAPTDDGAEVARVARALLARVRERERVRLAGVQVHNLVRDAEARRRNWRCSARRRRARRAATGSTARSTRSPSASAKKRSRAGSPMRSAPRPRAESSDRRCATRCLHPRLGGTAFELLQEQCVAVAAGCRTHEVVDMAVAGRDMAAIERGVVDALQPLEGALG